MHHRPLIEAVVHLLLTGVSVLVVAKILPGVQMKSYGSAVIFALVVSVLNALAWVFLAPLLVPFSVVTLGLGIFLINGVIFLLAGKIVGGAKISGCITGTLASIGVTAVNWVMHFFLGKWAP